MRETISCKRKRKFGERKHGVRKNASDKKKKKHLRRFTRQTERKVQKGKYKREEEDIWELRS